jgi:hypothetical protein
MPHPLSIFPKNEDQSLNFRFWTGVLLPPLAGGVNTLVAYMVSNYACSVHNRHLVFVEQAADDSTQTLRNTRRLLLALSYWFAAGFSLFILAGTVSTFLLHPRDL